MNEYLSNVVVLDGQIYARVLCSLRVTCRYVVLLWQLTLHQRHRGNGTMEALLQDNNRISINDKLTPKSVMNEHTQHRSIVMNGV